MRRVVSLICALSLSLGAAALNPNLSKRSNILKTDQICRAIQKVISNSSAVYYSSDVAYAQDILHWMDSSTQDSMCTVEPGTVGDVSNIVCYTIKYYSHQFQSFSRLDKSPRELCRSFWRECRYSNPLKERSDSYQHR